MRYISKEHLAVIGAASTDPTRYILNGVLFEETKKGLRAVATDGWLLAMVESETELKETDFPEIEALKNAPNTAKGAIINVDGLKQAAKGVAKKSRTPVLREIAVKMAETNSILASTTLENHTVVTPRNIEGTFPNYQQVIPKDESATLKIKFNPRLLGKAIEIAEQVMDRDSIELQFSTATSPLKIVGERKGYKMTLVVMPTK